MKLEPALGNMRIQPTVFSSLPAAASMVQYNQLLSGHGDKMVN